MTFKRLGQRPKDFLDPAQAFRQVQDHQLLFIDLAVEALEIGTLFMPIKLNFWIETTWPFPLGIWTSSGLQKIIEASVDMSETSSILQKPRWQASHCFKVKFTTYS